MNPNPKPRVKSSFNTHQISKITAKFKESHRSRLMADGANHVQMQQTFVDYILNETLDIHKKAGNDPLIKKLRTGEITSDEYAGHISVHFFVYQQLENLIRNTKNAPKRLLDFVKQVSRTNPLKQDFWHLTHEDISKQPMLKHNKSLSRYIHFLKKIEGNATRLTAHFFVRCGADLFGGQLALKALQKKFDRKVSNYLYFGEQKTVNSLQNELFSLVEDISIHQPESKSLFLEDCISAFKYTIAFNRELNSIIKK